MPSIDRLVAARYGPSGPHPLARRPWRPAGPAPTRDHTMEQRVRERLADADRLRRRGRLLRLGGGALGTLLFLALEAAALRWPWLDQRAATWAVHTLGDLLIVVGGLRHSRDAFFGPAEMAGVATTVTALLLVLVAGGLGAALWTLEARRDTALERPGEETP